MLNRDFLRNSHTVVVIQCQPRIWLEEIQFECNIAVQKHNYLTANIDTVVREKNPTAWCITNADTKVIQGKPARLTYLESYSVDISGA